MHAFKMLAGHAINYALSNIREAECNINTALNNGRSDTSLVIGLQMMNMQRAFIAVGVFSTYEAMLQDTFGKEDGFAFQDAEIILDHYGENDLKQTFVDYRNAINVLKHGKGSSYDKLLARKDSVPFNIKDEAERFFNEGDVSEVMTLIEVGDDFVLGCVDVITRVSNIIDNCEPNPKDFLANLQSKH
jgi:hypothetical protein